MKAGVICIGDELLIGQTINTNAAYIGEKFSEAGIRTEFTLVVADERNAIEEAMNFALNKVEFCVITGGLGPTKDDITKKVFADFFGVELIQDADVLKNVYSFFEKFNRDVQPVNELQALVPKGCTVLMNKMGTAPGMWMKKEQTVFVSLPGVPREMRYLVSEELLPRIQNSSKTEEILHKYLMTSGIGESYLAAKIEDIEEDLPEYIKLAYLPSRGIVKLRLSGTGEDRIKLEAEINSFIEKIAGRVEEYVFGFEDMTLAAALGHRLNELGLTLSVAESLTAGGVAKELSTLSGSSNYLRGGVVTYTEETKIKELGVKKESLEKHTVYSHEVAQEMAQGVAGKFSADIGISTTGVAGPTGGTKDKPVGRVYIGLYLNGKAYSKELDLGGDREGVRRRSVLAVLMLLFQHIK